MQQIAVEKDDAARCHLHRHRVIVRVGKIERLHHTVEALVVMLFGRPDHAGTMRAGNHPQAAVFDCGVIQRDPGAGQRAIARRR